MEQIFSGILRFQEDVYPQRKQLFERLASGQHPQAMFITCADSRVDPNLITQADPGELFICRNAGNIVPPHTNHTGGMTASIEFAVAALQVPNIVVCGHTDCGAMKGALDPEGLEELPHVAEWLYHSHAAVKATEALHGNADKKTVLRRLTEQNVLLQLQHLRTHPYVVAKLAAGKLQLHGWVFDIELGQMLVYNEEIKCFEPISQRYVDDTLGAMNGAQPRAQVVAGAAEKGHSV